MACSATRYSQGSVEGAHYEVGADVLAVLGRRVDVGRRVGVGHRETPDLLELGSRGRRADQRLLGLTGAHRCGRHAEERDAGTRDVARGVDLDRGDDAGEREVATA